MGPLTDSRYFGLLLATLVVGSVLSAHTAVHPQGRIDNGAIPRAMILVSGWTNVTKAYGPPEMAGGMTAYSSRDDAFLLFGGWNGVTYNQTWTFNPRILNWTQLHPLTSPSARGDGMLVYDSQDAAFVLFGGWFQLPSGDYVRDSDTWAFYLGNDSWIERHPLRSPSPRSDSAVAYDPETNMILLFGGFNGSAYLGDMWSYRLKDNSWVPRSSAIDPPSRADGRMIYDTAQRAFYLFSGNDYSGPNFTFHHLSDMWRYDWDHNAWVQLYPDVMPSPRDYPIFASDTAAGELLLTGGFGNRTILGDTWAFNTTRSAWSNITTSNGPSPRMAAVGGYDAQDDALMLFSGGDNSGAKQDTWMFLYPPPIEGTVSVAGRDLVEGQPVSFSASLHGGSGNFVRQQWRFGDGGTATGLSTSHTFATQGTFLVRFEAGDDRGDPVTIDTLVAVGTNLRFWMEISTFVILLGVSIVLITIWLQRRSGGRASKSPRLGPGELQFPRESKASPNRGLSAEQAQDQGRQDEE